MHRKLKIGFICTGNSARSQMAEGYAKYFAKIYGKDKNIEFFSAGSSPAQSVNSFAIKVMREDGVDISSHRPKSLEQIPYKELDIVITLCDNAAENCPYVPSARTEHWRLNDPARFQGPEDEKISFFRKIRDEIKDKVEKLIKEL